MRDVSEVYHLLAAAIGETGAAFGASKTPLQVLSHQSRALASVAAAVHSRAPAVEVWRRLETARIETARADHQAAQQELTRLHALPARSRRAAARVEVRCPHRCRVAAVYGTQRRLLVELRGEFLVTGTTTYDGAKAAAGHAGVLPRAGQRLRHTARWLDTADAGDVWTVDCRHGAYPVAVYRLRAHAGRGRQEIGVPLLAPA